jgi:hypothetical protein
VTIRRKNESRFRNFLFLIFAVLILGYAGYKTWHVSVALDAWQGQQLQDDITGAAR